MPTRRPRPRRRLRPRQQCRGPCLSPLCMLRRPRSRSPHRRKPAATCRGWRGRTTSSSWRGRRHRPNVPPAQPAGGEPAATTDLVVQSPSRQRAGKATSDPQKAAGSGSSAQDVEAASASSGWTPGGGTAVVNVAAQEVRNRLQSQAAALRKYNDEFLATRAAIRVSLPIFAFLILVSSVGARQRTHWV